MPEPEGMAFSVPISEPNLHTNVPSPPPMPSLLKTPPTKRLSSLFKLIKVSHNVKPNIKDNSDDEVIVSKTEECPSLQNLQQDMRANWTELPATLRRKLRHRESVLAEFTCDEVIPQVRSAVSTDSLLSSSSSTTSGELPLPPPPQEDEEQDSGTDVNTSIVSSDDEQQKERAIEECVRQDVINFIDDGTYEDVTPPQIITPPSEINIHDSKLKPELVLQEASSQLEEFLPPPEALIINAETIIAHAEIIPEVNYSKVNIKEKSIINKDHTEAECKLQQELAEKLSQRSLKQGNSTVSSTTSSGRMTVQQLFQLANDVSEEQNEGATDTLKDIQETLQRLEEKVRMYESRLEQQATQLAAQPVVKLPQKTPQQTIEEASHQV